LFLDDLSKGGALLLGLAIAGLLLAMFYGLRTLVRGAPKLLAAVLYSHLRGWSQRAAVAASALALLWGFLLAGAVYSPIAAFAPETLPTARAEARAILAVNLWVGVVAIPLVFGLVEAIAQGNRGRRALLLAPAGFVHLAVLALALLVIAPWLLTRRTKTLALRKKSETYICEVELERYTEVLEDWQRRLKIVGLAARATRASNFALFARWLVDRLGPPAFRSPVPYSISQIVSRDVQLILLESLLEISGSHKTIGRIRSAILGTLPPQGFWWTRSKEGRELEALILSRSGTAAPDVIRRRLAGLEVDSSEWSALQREYLLTEIERDKRDVVPA
jgi:hypothetical protein